MYDGKKIPFQKNTNEIPFVATDLRRFKLRYDIGLSYEIFSWLYQIDVLKLIKYCKKFNNLELATKLKRFIEQADKHDPKKLNTDFKRQLPRRSVEKNTF